MDVVIWGHEHECMIGSGMNSLAESAENTFTVLQPGSTVATALVAGEAKPKHVALLQVPRAAWGGRLRAQARLRGGVRGDWGRLMGG